MSASPPPPHGREVASRAEGTRGASSNNASSNNAGSRDVDSRGAGSNEVDLSAEDFRDSDSLAQAKRALRVQAHERRTRAAQGDSGGEGEALGDGAVRGEGEAYGEFAARAACKYFLEAFSLESGAVVAGYLPMRDELDPRPLLGALGARGHSLALPVVVAPGAALVFRRWRAGDALEAGAFDTRHPLASAEVLTPDWLLVPLLAFDRAGFRLGYGGGFYDRTLGCLESARAVGFAFAAQEEKARLPRGAHDRALDCVATERGIIRACDS